MNDFANMCWDDLGRRIQLDFKRTKIQLTILLRETDLEAKFELFQRLNSGGTNITGQELRNAITAGINPNALKWFENLASNKDFIAACGLAQRDKATRFDVELVLRFVAFLSPEIENLPKAKGVDIFLTSVLRSILDNKNFDYDGYEESFVRIFSIINKSWGENALRYKSRPGSGKFSISFFEAVALGIAQNLDNLPDTAAITSRINSIGDSTEFKSASGSGKNAQRRIPELVKHGKSYFSANK